MKLDEIVAENKRLIKKIKDAEADKKHINDKYKKFKEKIATKEAQRAKKEKKVEDDDIIDVHSPSPVIQSPVPKIDLKREVS